MSGVAVYEAAAGLARIGATDVGEMLALVEAFLKEVNASVMPIDITVTREAVAAFARFGKGHHPAALNMGDCFAYGCARRSGTPLLCKGNDFPRTDLELA